MQTPTDLHYALMLLSSPEGARAPADDRASWLLALGAVAFWAAATLLAWT